MRRPNLDNKFGHEARDDNCLYFTTADYRSVAEKWFVSPSWSFIADIKGRYTEHWFTVKKVENLMPCLLHNSNMADHFFDKSSLKISAYKNLSAHRGKEAFTFPDQIYRLSAG